MWHNFNSNNESPCSQPCRYRGAQSLASVIQDHSGEPWILQNILYSNSNYDRECFPWQPLHYWFPLCLEIIRVPWWFSILRVWHCHCWGSGHCNSMSSVPNTGTFHMPWAQPKKKRRRESILWGTKAFKSLIYLYSLTSISQACSYRTVVLALLFSPQTGRTP